MVELFVTLGVLILIVLGAEKVLWMIFRWKMAPFRFPSTQDPTGSHDYYLRKIRLFVIAHTIFLAAFVAIFCIILW